MLAHWLLAYGTSTSVFNSWYPILFVHVKLNPQGCWPARNCLKLKNGIRFLRLKKQSERYWHSLSVDTRSTWLNLLIHRSCFESWQIFFGTPNPVTERKGTFGKFLESSNKISKSWQLGTAYRFLLYPKICPHEKRERFWSKMPNGDQRGTWWF